MVLKCLILNTVCSAWCDPLSAPLPSADYVSISGLGENTNKKHSGKKVVPQCCCVHSLEQIAMQTRSTTQKTLRLFRRSRNHAACFQLLIVTAQRERGKKDTETDRQTDRDRDRGRDRVRQRETEKERDRDRNVCRACASCLCILFGGLFFMLGWLCVCVWT